jgi:3'(2'), 5'-bisphosphate nucleotidase
MNLSQLIDPVVVLATEAGKAILEVYASDFDVQAKDDQTPLTQADVASHHIIVAGLEKLTPDLPILSEESGLPDFGERGQWNPYWLVDPLDGTREFVSRNGEFTVNIALIEDQCRSGKRPIRAARALARTSGPTANIRNRSA